MRLQNTILFVSITVLLFGCVNERESKQSVVGENISDTLICSSPSNYLMVLDDFDHSRKVEVRNYKDMLELFEELEYTTEAWQAGIRVVPRVYLPLIGDRWSTQSKELVIANKKRIFLRGIAPLILRANELIMIDRNRLEEIRSSFTQNKSISEKDTHWVLKLAKLYKVNSDEEQITAAMINELWEKVDIIPTSLALAQGIEESGWGTSRFAAVGNAIYGQWTWGEKAIIPEKQRKELGNYGIASFDALQESVCAYMINLNTHNAYANLRGKRAEMRKKGGKITGIVLAEQLTKYSERGEEYVKTLKSLMEANQLGPTDEAYLSDDPPIYLIPIAD
jgi:uncharacterized FlgJ-related protein